MIVNCVNPNQQCLLDLQDRGLSYFNNDNETTTPGRGRGRGGIGRFCGGPCGGHGQGWFGGHQHQHDAHSSHEGEEEGDEEDIVGNNNDTSCNVTHYSSSSNTMSTAKNFLSQDGWLPNKWLLFDSRSTTNIISNLNLLLEIHDALELTWIRCIAG
jgi:hypothetical protein